LRIEDVSFGYDDRLILSRINLTVYEQDFLAVIGPNGGGKTTLLKLILGLLRPDSGRLTVMGRPPVNGAGVIGYVPQSIYYDRDFPLSAFEVVLSGLIGPRSFFPRYTKDDRQRVDEIMNTLGVTSIKQRPFGQLSGGQRQRVLIARALVSRPAILLLDEPTASIDPQTEKDIYDFLMNLSRSITIILVSHDVAFVHTYINRVACLNREMVVNDADDISREFTNDLYHYPSKKIQHHCQL
jgi:zinc transport system ATP-binding protein